MPAAPPLDPWSAGFMALGSIAQPAPVSSGASSNQNLAFDNSGFVVNVGSGTAGSTKSGVPSLPESVQAVAAGVGGLLSSPLVIIGIGVAAFLYLRK